MFLPSVGSLEYGIMIWIIAEVAALIIVIRINMTRQINPRILSVIGLSIVVFGTFFYLVFGLAIFSINEFDSICQNSVLSSDTLLEDIENKILGEKLLDCFEKNNEKKWDFFALGMITAMVIVFGSVLQAISHRN